ncbi:hypothetical protein E4U31_005617 [Claviceps sp. LM219 group G6]|nr:hypothetical protein E4U31_005617 [Claviceps sp. LM219 group G6]
MDANTNPSLRQPDFGAAADMSRGFADQMDRCRNLPAVQDGAQWAELSGRMGTFEGKIDNLDSKVQNLDTKVQNLDTKIQHLDANIQRLETKVDARMGTLENRMGALETKVGALETGMRTLQTNMTSLETNIINRLDDFMALLTSRSTEVDEKFAKHDKKIDAVRKNATARLDNRMSGSSDPLWPLCAVETGEAIDVSSRDELDGLAHALKAQRLTELGEIPISSREGRTLQLRRAYGVDLLANVAWNPRPL